MDTRARLVMAGLVVGAMVTGTRSVCAQGPTLVLDVQNRAGISAALLQDVETGVTRIFREAGITVVWGGPHPLTVMVISSAMAAEMHQVPERMGFAPGPGSREAYVVEGRIEAACISYRANRSGILAAAIAHELGHLLLPPHAHAPTGIMRADWNESDFARASAGHFFFMPSQSKELRRSLTNSELVAVR
jgi:hypothetical protein